MKKEDVEIITTDFNGKEPAFIKVYLKNILALANVKGTHSDLLNALVKMASYAGTNEKNEYGGMEIVINATIKRRLMKELGLKNVGSVANGLSALVKGKMIYRVGSGVYQLSPYVFGKGDWKDVSELRMIIDYRESGKEIRVQTKQYGEDEFGEVNEDAFELPYDLGDDE